MPPHLHGQRVVDYTDATGPQSVESPRFYALPDWARTHNRGRVAFIRELAKDFGHEPQMRWYTANMLRKAGVAPRDYPQMAKAILRHVQQNVYYTQEAGEQLQNPWRTLDQRNGDCDDQALLLAAMAESVGLPWVLALAGADSKGRPVRWTDGSKWVEANYTHIYPILGWPPNKPSHWAAAEPTLHVPLGYDVTIHGMDFDHHGRPTPRPVQLDLDGIAVVGSAGGVSGAAASSAIPFAGPTLSPAVKQLPFALGAVLSVALGYYLWLETR
jgi:hypothetical protein